MNIVTKVKVEASYLVLIKSYSTHTRNNQVNFINCEGSYL